MTDEFHFMTDKFHFMTEPTYSLGQISFIAQILLNERSFSIMHAILVGVSEKRSGEA